MAQFHYTKAAEGPTHFAVTPETVGWEYLSFSVVTLAAGETHTSLLDDQETAIVPLEGSGTVAADEQVFVLSRESVFTEMPSIVYAPPRVQLTVTTDEAFTFAIGSAPAEGRYPVRLFEPSEMKAELRGGGQAYRQVHHVLASPLPAERLILYEVYVPRGTWSGWAPHCHDGRDGSPYLEETYYFKLDPPNGFAMHRNWRDDEDFEEHFTAKDGEVVTVTKGYHSSVACPSSHMFFLNFLAGEPQDEERSTPPCFDEAFTWIQDDWDFNAWDLPVIKGPTMGDT